MKLVLFLTIGFLLAYSFEAAAQPAKPWIKQRINNLASPAMSGRGYVSRGVEKAANYLSSQFQSFGLRSFSADSSYFQTFDMAVNTFPGSVYLTLGKKDMRAGSDYIVHAASSSYRTEKIRTRTINLRNIKDSLAWSEVKARLGGKRAYILKNTDTVTKYLHFTNKLFGEELPAGLFIIPRHGKLTWTVSQTQVPATVFYVEDTVMPRRIRKVAATLEAKFLPSFKSYNVAGYVRGTDRPDSFIIFTAHFDHLGKMGRSTVFPGAHDNASGTSLMLYLANYFSRHPQRYTMVFIGFSGEEAGLVGSKYFTEHPLFPLANVRFVINTDMTGDAKNGITVVNALQQKEAFALLNKINDEKDYLPKINERDQTQNSDHYPFSAHNVPAIFIYGNGTKGFYHDIFDKPQELSLEHIDHLANLLTDFVVEISR